MPVLHGLPLDERQQEDNCIVYVTSLNRADRLGHQLAMHLRAAHAHLRRRSNLVFSTFGMTADQYVLLTVLAECGEATQQDLVRRCYSDTATIGAMLSLLEAKGFVTRKPHPQDGRALRVRLTRRGIRLAQEMRRRSSTIRTDMVGLFNEQELHTLIKLLDRLAGAMPPPARKTATFYSSRLETSTPAAPRRRD
jgi:DNA-binding MarR family transcriptional regulator